MDKAEDGTRNGSPRHASTSTRPRTVEYGITSFVFRAKRPSHPARLHVALGSRPRSGALAGLLRLKGFAWLATRPRQQAEVAIAGTQFTMSPGDKWKAAVQHHFWPDEVEEEMRQDLLNTARDPTGNYTWVAEYGDRRTELVCIGRELDSEAARVQLEPCLLTSDEMAASKESWLALADPFVPNWQVHGAHNHIFLPRS
jgi:G3E family GTPase